MNVPPGISIELRRQGKLKPRQVVNKVPESKERRGRSAVFSSLTARTAAIRAGILRIIGRVIISALT